MIEKLFEGWMTFCDESLAYLTRRFGKIAGSVIAVILLGMLFYVLIVCVLAIPAPR